ncbi:hypothetical protein [Portibacter lacus]|uniref:Uncharacterized protein n=1 Tax=Portibacter lacus TaxID=1099794 RepID=A0AA37SRM4_9BACT|nr:hypothetical protein [Portibacter lacus]GLR16655.1 hypothetical protein GCM10007940_12700 [Portibacter lacus]
MYKFLINKGQTLAFILGAGLSIIFALFIYIGIKDRDLAQMSNEALIETDIFNFGIYAAIALIALAAVLVFVIFAIAGLLRDFKSSLKVLIGIGLILVLFFIFYTVATPDETGILARLAGEFDISDNISKFISAGINTTLSLLGLALVIWLFSELRNALK